MHVTKSKIYSIIKLLIIILMKYIENVDDWVSAFRMDKPF